MVGKWQEMCEGLECQNKEFKHYPCTNGIFRLYLQGKHRTDLRRERPRAGRKRWGCHNCTKCNSLGDYSDSNRRKGTTSRNLRHKETITRFRRGFKVTLLESGQEYWELFNYSLAIKHTLWPGLMLGVGKRRPTWHRTYSLEGERWSCEREGAILLWVLWWKSGQVQWESRRKNRMRITIWTGIIRSY